MPLSPMRFRFRSPLGRIAPALGAALIVWASPASAQSTSALWGTLPLPGGAAAAREAMGLGDPDGRLASTVLVDFIRRYASVDTRAASLRFEQHLAAASTATDASSASPLPLPLPAFWQGVFGPDQDLLLSLLRHRGALLTYHGLMGLDASTLATVANHPALLRSIMDDSAAASAFAAFSGGLRASDAGVQTPGGQEFAASWQALVGESSSDISPFIQALMTRDGGRLAWFFTTVAGLPDSTRRFVLAAPLPPAERIAAVHAVYERFRAVDPNWRLDTRPFVRPSFDGALMLLLTEVDADGTVGPAWWPEVFDELSAAGDWGLRRSPVTAETDRRADARWMFEWVFADGDDVEAHRRFGALRFAQRLSAALPRSAAADVRAAVGGALATPLLMFTLERLGIRDAGVFAAAASAARTATNAGGESQVLPLLARWQAALGLLEQVQRRVSLSERQITSLVRSLIAVAPTGSRDEPPAVATWVVDELMAMLVPQRLGSAALEDAFLRAATTSRTTRPAQFTWEGLPYLVDTPTVTWRSATAIRRARPGPQLQDLVELVELYRIVSDPPGAPQASTLAARLERIAAVAATLESGDDDRLRAFSRMVEASSGTPAATVSAHVVAGALDAVTDVVVPSLLYALAVSPTTEPILYPEAWTRHSLQQPSAAVFATKRPWREVAWQFPTDYGLGGGTRLIGAYLGIDLALADAQLVRLVSTTMPVPGVIDDAMQRGVVERLVLEPPAGDAAALSAMPARLAAGRRRAAAWRSGADEAEMRSALREAHVDPWRINALAFEMTEGRVSAIEGLSLTELVSLGGTADPSPGRPAPSVSSRLADGCLCVLAARAVTPEQLRGRRLGIQALQPLDISLRLAELVAELGLDAAVVPALMAPALQDWLDRSRPAWTDDWEAYTVWPRMLPVDRVEEYLLFLVSTGVFSPPAPTEVAP